MAEQNSKPIDALIITGLHEELTALLSITPDYSLTWQLYRDNQKFPYHLGQFKALDGTSLLFAAAWAGGMGETAAAERSRGLVSFLRPRCLAMCGICAGRRGDVFLGDVIVASRVFSYDHGKILATADTDAVEDGFFRDIETYNLERIWQYDATYFSRRTDWCQALLERRPLSLEFQCRWVLRGLLISQDGITKTLFGKARHKFCPRWSDVVISLKKRGYIEIVGKNLHLTAEGRKAASEDYILYPDAPMRDPPFRVHVGPIATGKTVRQDPEIFQRIAKFSRNVKGLEMEAAAIGFVAGADNLPSIVVKSVADYADATKDDSFREFGCVISATFVTSFLKEHPPSSLRNTFGGAQSTQWGVHDFHDYTEAVNKNHAETKEYLDHILRMLEGTIPPGDISVGHARTTNGDQRLVINVPLTLKNSEWDRKLHTAVGSDAQIRYISGGQIGNPGETIKPKGFANGVVRPVHLGLRIRGDGPFGTLGPFVESSNGEPGFLTAAHVLNRRTGELNGSPVIQGDATATTIPKDVIGFSADRDSDLDACIVRLRYGVQFIGNVVPVGYDFPYEGETIRSVVAPNELVLGTPAFKIGASSGLTSGIITAVSIQHLAVQHPSGAGKITLHDLFEITSKTDKPFTMPGDSGAVVYTRISDQLFCLGFHLVGGLMMSGEDTVPVSYGIPIWKLIGHFNAKWIDWAVL